METCWLPHAYLLHDPVNLAILCINLIAHIQGHVTEVSNDAAHLLQVFIHFIFSGIICYPGSETAILVDRGWEKNLNIKDPKLRKKSIDF